MMDSREEDIFHIGINDVDSFDSDDNEEIEHVHRIEELPLEQSIRDEGQQNPLTFPLVYYNNYNFTQ